MVQEAIVIVLTLEIRLAIIAPGGFLSVSLSCCNLEPVVHTLTKQYNFANLLNYMTACMLKCVAGAWKSNLGERPL